MAYAPPPLEVIWERILAAQREREALAQQAYEERRAGRPLRRHRPPRSTSPEITRDRLRQGTRKHYADLARQDPDSSPLRLLRIERGLTLAEAAEAAGVGAHTTWWRAETASEAHNVSAEVWAKIAAFLDVPVDEIRP